MELSWAWELGNRERELGDYTQAKDPSVMFIAETWTNEARLKIVKCRLKFYHMFSVLRINRGGGACFVLEGFDEFASGNIFKKSY